MLTSYTHFSSLVHSTSLIRKRDVNQRLFALQMPLLSVSPSRTPTCAFPTPSYTTTFSNFKSLMTIYLDIPIQPHLNHLI